MKETPENRSPLDRLLKDWQVREPLPPRFQERVWQRIASAEHSLASPARWGTFWAALQGWLARPQAAVGLVSALLVLGFAAGLTHGLEKSARMDEALSTRYVQVIDPYLSR